MVRYFENKPRLTLGLKLLFIALVAVAIMVPFASQPFSYDGPLVLDFAAAQVDHPLQQHIDNFDYFGIHFDRYTNTHPRFLSFYLSQVIRISGGIFEVPIHLSLIVFPVIGAFGMFFLGRRFGVSGMTAALLFLASPVLMIASHTEMVDAPGLCLWLGAMAAFIYGVDRNRIWLLVLAGLLMQLTIFTFFQGLTALVLAMIYLVLKNRLRIRYLLPIFTPALVFAGYILWFFSIYGEVPHFSYRIVLSYQKEFLAQLRGILIAMGSTMLFPLALLIGYWRNWRALIVGALSAGIAVPWLVVKARAGDYSTSETVLLATFVVSGITICYAMLESFGIGIFNWIKGRDNDNLLLSAWFLGVFAYCMIFLGYPAPRYFLPAMPPVILLMLRFWRRTMVRWPVVRIVLASMAIGLTLSSGVALSLAYKDYALEAKETADWAKARYGEWQGRVWFSGELGFAYYMRKNGFSMVPGIRGKRYPAAADVPPPESPATGDIIIYSPLAASWLPEPDVLARTRPIDKRTTWSEGPIALMGLNQRTQWGIIFLLPYGFIEEPQKMDDIFVVYVVDEAVPLPPELQEEVDKWK